LCKWRGEQWQNYHHSPQWRTAIHLPSRCPVQVSLGFLRLLYQSQNRLVIHFCELADKVFLLGKFGIDVIDNVFLDETMMGEERTCKQRRERSHRLIGDVGSDKALFLHLRNRSASKFQRVVLAII